MYIKDQSSGTRKVFLFSFYLFGRRDVVTLVLVCMNNDHILALDAHNHRANK